LRDSQYFYRDMSLIKACSECESEDLVKKRQRYKCKVCDHTFTVSKLGQVKPPEVLRMVLQLYLEGLSFRGIERILQASYVPVLKWVRRWGKAIEAMRKEAAQGGAFL
jgi:transposase-like protein